MKLRYIGLAEFEPRLPQDKQRVVNGDIVEVKDKRLVRELIRTARWEEAAPKRPKRVRKVPFKVVEPPPEIKAEENTKGVEDAE